jgi:hypothetical protein
MLDRAKELLEEVKVFTSDKADEIEVFRLNISPRKED